MRMAPGKDACSVPCFVTAIMVMTALRKSRLPCLPTGRGTRINAGQATVCTKTHNRGFTGACSSEACVIRFVNIAGTHRHRSAHTQPLR